MIDCKRSTGQKFLAGELAEAQELAYADHIANCHQCRQWLEADSGDAWSWKLAEELAWAPQPHTSLSPTEQDLAVDVNSSGDLAQGLLNQIRSIIAPTDDPKSIGRLGTYEIVGLIGRGGMGVVVKAFEPALNRYVAIKLLDPALMSVGAARVRFAREAKAMAAIAHENVVPVYAVDQYQELPYFVMEYVVGGTLEHRLGREGSLDVSSVVRIAMQVAEALAAADAQGLVHRDIKPGNILLDRGTERVRVGDFGLARVASEASDTRSGLIAGTPQYMSPEQVRGHSVDGRSDLFSLGAVMYAMCTGHSPFRAEGVYAVMQRIVQSTPRSIREQNPAVPEWLESFILRLLEKSPELRFQSAAAVAGWLRSELAHLQNPSEVKQPQRPWRRVVRPRSRMASGAWGLVALTTALVAIGAAWAIRFERASDLRPGTSRQSPAAQVVTDQRTNPSAQLADVPQLPEFNLREPNLPAMLPPVEAAVLWESDGTDALWDRLRRFRREVTSEFPETWLPDEDLESLKQRLERFNEESL